ncbi:MAG: diphosphatase [Actinomycetota bacterium]|nr:diphosphatase [Actinomycetota bacterium]
MSSTPHTLEGVSGSSETLRDLSLARGTLNRAGPRRSEPDLLPLLLKDPHTKVLELVGDRAKVTGSDGGSATLMLRAPQEQDTLRLAVFLGRDDDGTAYVGVVGEVGDGEGSSDTGAVPGGSGSSEGGSSTSWSSEPAPSSGTLVSWRTLREVGALLSDRDAGMFATMLGLANWHASHTHCPICGAMTTPAHAGWIRRCTQDGTEHFPRTDPAVIMAVTDASDRLLLARSPHWAPGRLSVLAGFVEPGESLEAAVAREVYEEVGVVVEQVRYLGNQPWPFPSSLMVGFSARALGPRLHLDQVEIVEAMWVTREELSEMVLAKRFGIAPTVSIARRMIEHWYGGPVG